MQERLFPHLLKNPFQLFPQVNRYFSPPYPILIQHPAAPTKAMADLGGLQVLPPELHIEILRMANLQTVCRFSQVNRRARALVQDLPISSIAKVRPTSPQEAFLRYEKRLRRGSPELRDPFHVITSDVWSYDMIASTLRSRPCCMTSVGARPTVRSICNTCLDISLASLSVVLLDPQVEEIFYDVRNFIDTLFLLIAATFQFRDDG